LLDVLVVEEDAPTRFCFKELLRLEGYSVTVAEDAGIGLEKARGHKLIILSAGFGGEEALRFLKERSRFEEISQIPTIVTSTSFLESHEEVLRFPNIVDFLYKPFAIDDFIKKVKVILLVETSQ